ncbi:MAG TPA: DUF4292 domain-containing protein [Spirochaetota bacterium]|nr:DUF4292 domain-containing protein [Spirochaetota bacterium]
MITKQHLVIVLTVASLLSCATAAERETGAARGTVTGDSAAAGKLMLAVKEINDNSPATISTSFTADGASNGQKFKIEGTAVFDRKCCFKISVVDYVFRSRVLDAYREMDSLYFYYPAEKKLLVDDVYKIDIFRYTGFQTSFDIMYTLLTGGIPMLKDSSVTKCVAGTEADSFNLVLENSEYMQNIYFKGSVPERIMIIHKSTKDRMEIYLKSRITKDKSVFFKNIRIVAPEKNISANINFLSPSLNAEIKPEKFKREVFKKDVEVIKVN